MRRSSSTSFALASAAATGLAAIHARELREGRFRAEGGRGACLGERDDGAVPLRVEVPGEREGLVGLLRHEREVVGDGEERVDRGLHGGERGVGRGGLVAEGEDRGIGLRGVLPGLLRGLVGLGRLGGGEVGLLGHHIGERGLELGLLLVGLEEVVGGRDVRERPVHRREHLRRAHHAVVVRVDQLQRAPVEPEAVDWRGKRRPELAVQLLEVGDVLARLDLDLRHASGLEVAPIV